MIQELAANCDPEIPSGRPIVELKCLSFEYVAAHIALLGTNRKA